jgi:hypothetical protein
LAEEGGGGRRSVSDMTVSGSEELDEEVESSSSGPVSGTW